MQTLQPTLRLGRDVWDRAAMPAEEFHDRASRLREAMREADLDALLLYGSGLNGCGHPTYLSNYIVKLPFSALVVLPREGEPALMFEGAARGRSAAQTTTWIEDVRPCWAMADTCLEVLTERRLLSARIGLAGLPELMPHADWATLAAVLDRATLVDAEGLVSRQRAIKSHREREQVRRATQIVTRALAAPPSVDEALLAAHLIREARMQGAEDIRVMIGRPKDGGAVFRPPEDTAIADGDPVNVMLAASWERYWSEEIRSYTARNGRLELVWNDEMSARFRAIVASVQPGLSIGDWAGATLAAMTPAEQQALVSVGLGHGIGITPVETPHLSPGEPLTIQSGMCLVVCSAMTSEENVVLHAETVIA
jgi:Xaa-Pro aminopeptidase